MTLTFIQGVVSSLTKFSIDFDRILSSVEDCWSDEPRSHFISSDEHGENTGKVISCKTKIETDVKKTLAFVRQIAKSVSFKADMMNDY